MSASDSGTDCEHGERKRRLFFALWPDDETRTAAIGATRTIVEQSGGRATPAENVHVTLAFLGDIGDAEFAQIRKMPAPPCERFELSIDTLDYRKRPRLLWAVPGIVPAALLSLESWLWGRLEDVGIRRERRAYRPHVTLARRADSVGLELLPLRWPVREFVLVKSTLGPPHSTYEIVERWPLRNPRPAAAPLSASSN